jgi:hypothetical protein
MIRVAPILLLGAACAHGGALDRRADSEMKNDSPAISPWTGPEDNPIADVGGDVAVTAVVNRVHGMAVEVLAAGGGGKINVASGVLAGGGVVLTDLRALLVPGPGGSLRPPAAIAVLTTKGALPARLVAGALDADVAVLELPQAALALEGPPLAEGPPADQLLAVRAAKRGHALAFEVIAFSMQQSQDRLGLRSASPVPISFAGAPVFDSAGELAGLLVGANEHDVVLVPSARLLQIIATSPGSYAAAPLRSSTTPEG